MIFIENPGDENYYEVPCIKVLRIHNEMRYIKMLRIYNKILTKMLETHDGAFDI
jgi:hypothetical protein